MLFQTSETTKSCTSILSFSYSLRCYSSRLELCITLYCM